LATEEEQRYYDEALNAWASAPARVTNALSRGLLQSIEAGGFSLGIDGRLRVIAILTELEAGRKAVSSRILCDYIAPLIVRDPNGRDRLQKVVDQWWRVSVDRTEIFGRVHYLRSLLNRLLRSRLSRAITAIQLVLTMIATLILTLPAGQKAWERISSLPAVDGGAPTGDVGAGAVDHAPSVADVLAREPQIPLVMAAAAVALLVAFWLAFVALQRAGIRRGRSQDRTRRTELHLDATHERADARRLDGLIEPFRRPVCVHQRLDIVGSVVASARAAGFFTLVEMAARTLPSYILLIDRRSNLDHAAHTAEDFGDALGRAGLEVRQFFFEAAPDRVRDARGGRTVPLSKVSAVRGERLILFGDGVDLSSALGPRWFDMLSRWERSAFLDLGLDAPAVAGRAKAMERSGVARNAFDVLGFEQTGRHLNDAPDRAATGSGEDALRHYPLLFGDRDRLTTETTIDPDELQALDRELAHWLGPNVYRWLCACAIYPIITPQLTASLGTALHDHLDRPVSHSANAGRLKGLPWMRLGDMPDWLRIHLIGQLGKADAKMIRTLLRGIIFKRAGDSSGSAATRMLFGSISRDGSTADQPFVEFMARRIERSDRPSLAATRALKTLLSPVWLDRSAPRFWLATLGVMTLFGLVGAAGGRMWAIQIAAAPRSAFVILLVAAAVGLFAYGAGLLGALYAGTIELNRSLQRLVEELATINGQSQNRSRLPRWLANATWAVDAAFRRARLDARPEEDTRVRIFLLLCVFSTVFAGIAIAAVRAAVFG
jgi:hypothetical protein